MPTGSNHKNRTGGGGGSKPTATSPTSSVHPSPSFNHPSLPRLKLNIRTGSPSSPSASKSKRPRTKASNQRRLPASSDEGSSSDLTPPDDDDDDDDDIDDDDDGPEEAEDDDDGDADFNEELITPRKGVHKGRNTPTQNNFAREITPIRKSTEKKKNTKSTTVGGGTGSAVKSKTIPKNDGKKKKSHPTTSTISAPIASSSKTTTGPAGREKKRAIKLEEVERRRARDAKFSMDDTFGAITQAPSSSSLSVVAPPNDDATSSFGDDESDLGNLTEDDIIAGLPEAFAGHEIEDLAYGAGPDGDLERQAMAFWDEQDESEEDEEEQLFINQLSGSEIDQQSQSSADGIDSDETLSDSDFSSSSDDGLDEFGFPIPSASLFPIEEEDNGNAADPGLVLMENWDGQFVLVQPRQERSRSRHRGDRGSRTNGSVSGSTTLSGNEQPGLLIDPDAADHEFDSDSSSYWSGMSDEDGGGDTTDSMAEEDMPMLDSPALNDLMEQQMAEAVLRMAVEAGEVSLLPELSGPSIVVTDAAGMDVHTPALSTSSSTGPAPGPSVTLPQTPAPAAAPPVPVMGTFHPITDDPAQHAVIDGSGTATKSPFTHRRRSRRGRDAASVASTKHSHDEKKRKIPADPFSPAPTHAVFGLGKRARYSSIPGHPRYVAARRAAEPLVDPHDRETTPTDSDAFSLEDMLETSVLMHELEAEQENGAETDADAEHLRHMIRFDRVGVSTYLRRNFGGGGVGAREEVPGAMGVGFTSPSNNAGGLGMRGALEDTLVGPMGAMGGRMLISPVLAPVVGEERRERKKKRRAGGVAASQGIVPMPALQI
ncbi:hypothetical protein CI109_105778 [Kwoniella shandongensis]|uniref:Uncharacterized protein n=1 Tax=Kwoniella shandongensis TaxID=1734106 RepID=A0A5M6C521_9TREE|nr:uncharacterized protein CI109_003117 [Kwoniella shandongensis]KAA5528585.1 hypothetical protein CI109_003117 [Kwoniella shandongensis]